MWASTATGITRQASGDRPLLLSKMLRYGLQNSPKKAFMALAAPRIKLPKRTFNSDYLLLLL